MSRLSNAFRRSNRGVRTPSTGDQLETENAPSPQLEYRQSDRPSTKDLREATEERGFAPAAARKSSERKGSLGSVSESSAGTPAAAAAADSAAPRRGSVASRASLRLAPSTFKRTDSENWKSSSDAMKRSLKAQLDGLQTQTDAMLDKRMDEDPYSIADEVQAQSHSSRPTPAPTAMTLYAADQNPEDVRRQIADEHAEVEHKVKHLLSLSKAVHKPGAAPLGVLQRSNGDAMVVGDEEVMREVAAALDAWDAAESANWAELHASQALTISQRKLLAHATTEVRMAKRAWAVFKQQQVDERETIANEINILTSRLLHAHLEREASASAKPDGLAAERSVSATMDAHGDKEDVLRSAAPLVVSSRLSARSTKLESAVEEDEETGVDPMHAAHGPLSPETSRLPLALLMPEADKTAGDPPEAKPPRRKRFEPVVKHTSVIEVQTDPGDRVLQVDAFIRKPTPQPQPRPKPYDEHRSQPHRHAPTMDDDQKDPYDQRAALQPQPQLKPQARPSQLSNESFRPAEAPQSQPPQLPPFTGIHQPLHVAAASKSHAGDVPPPSVPAPPTISAPDAMLSAPYAYPNRAVSSAPPCYGQPYVHPPAMDPALSARYLAAAAAAHLLRQHGAAHAVSAPPRTLNHAAAMAHAQSTLAHFRASSSCASLSSLSSLSSPYGFPRAQSTVLSHSMPGSAAAAAGAHLALPPGGAKALPPDHAWGPMPFSQQQAAAAAPWTKPRAVQTSL